MLCRAAHACRFCNLRLSSFRRLGKSLAAVAGSGGIARPSGMGPKNCKSCGEIIRPGKGLATAAPTISSNCTQSSPDGNTMNSHPTKPKPDIGLKPTPQDRDGRVMALDCPQGELSEPMRAYFAKCVEKIGFVPNVLRAYAHDTTKLEVFAAFYNDLMLAPSGLSKLEREMIAVVVSSQNHCYYCLTAHGAAVRQLSGDPVLGEVMAMNYRAADLAPRRRAMLDFAVKLTDAPYALDEADREGLRRAGFSERDIWDIVAV